MQSDCIISQKGNRDKHISLYITKGILQLYVIYTVVSSIGWVSGPDIEAKIYYQNKIEASKQAMDNLDKPREGCKIP